MTNRNGSARVTKIQVSWASCFLVGAERSRCHEAVFNRISPSLLDIFHDSRAVSHFLNDISADIFGLSAWLLCEEPASEFPPSYFAQMVLWFSPCLDDVLLSMMRNIWQRGYKLKCKGHLAAAINLYIFISLFCAHLQGFIQWLLYVLTQL